MINVNSSKLIIVAYMSPYLVLLILEFLPARLATLPYGLDSNVTQLLENMLTYPSIFYYLPSIFYYLVSIKLLLFTECTSILIILSAIVVMRPFTECTSIFILLLAIVVMRPFTECTSIFIILSSLDSRAL